MAYFVLILFLLNPSGVELTSAAIIPNPLMQQAAQAWKQEHEQEKQQQGQQQRKRRKQLKAKKQALSLPVRRHDLVSTLQRHKGMPETLIAADLAAHCGYQFVKQLQDPPMFGSSRALQVHCNRTNRLRTVLQIPRAQLQQLDSSQQQQLIACLEQTSGLHHPHTLQVHEVFVTPLHLNIVLEECSAGRLTDFSSKLHSTWGPAGAQAAMSPDLARWYFQQVVLAVQYCHEMTEAHAGGAQLSIEETVLKVRCNIKSSQCQSKLHLNCMHGTCLAPTWTCLICTHAACTINSTHTDSPVSYAVCCFRSCPMFPSLLSRCPHSCWHMASQP